MSSAAFIIIAAAIVPHSRVTIEAVGVNRTRTGLLDILRDMGGHMGEINRRLTGGEPVADLTIQFDKLAAAKVSGNRVVRAIDEFPVWAVAATQASGASTLQEASELRLKEVDRIALLSGELSKMGVIVQEHDDGFMINGPVRLRGARLDSHGDHRLGMALAVAGLVATSPSIIENADCISDSFPGFASCMQAIGANIQWD
jgi:3-phosphoshikimate 1-carboxyvinyltransferase